MSYKTGDEDILEKGHILKEKLNNASFQFKELAGV